MYFCYECVKMCLFDFEFVFFFRVFVRRVRECCFFLFDVFV